MRALQLVMIAALSIAVPITAEAQYTTGQQTTTTATSTNDATQSPENQWIASGFAGGNFANNADPSSPAFGGSIGPPTTGPNVARDTTASSSSPSGLSDAVLSGLHFWRADIGVALRW